MEIKKVFENAQNGDEASKELIFKEFYTPIYKYVRFRVKVNEDAEDLTQSIFLKLFSNIKNMTPASPRALLFTIARNTIIDHWRTRKSYANIDDHIETLFEGSGKPDTEKRDILQALGMLSEKEQEILELSYFSDLDSKTIANIVNKTEDNVRQIKSRALKKLRSIIDKEDYNE